MNHPLENKIAEVLAQTGFEKARLEKRDVRIETLIYMLYWYHRLSVKPDEQKRLQDGLQKYLANKDTVHVLSLIELDIASELKEYIEKELQPIPTVDLVCIRDSKILCVKRESYPEGLSLIGGLLRDDDESNDLNTHATLFAALRVAGQKILQTNTPIYSAEFDEHNNKIYTVSSKDTKITVKIYPHDRFGYRFHENLKSVLRPSDTRHIVDTVGFKCIIEGEVNEENLVWKTKQEALDGVVFEHHREIISHVTAQSSLEQELLLQEKDFIQKIIEKPFESWKQLQKKFKNESDINASFPDLFPVVNQLLTEMYTDSVNSICKEYPICIGIRDKATISLRHVSLKNRVFCPYLPTLRAIFEAVAFFDIIARHRRGFYLAQKSNGIIEHNPREIPNASYHMYRYKYRLDDMLSMIPHEILIPTFASLTATDLMKIRGVPIRFLGLATDFIYVDEFEQSPEEFLMHDCNHSWRMIEEDKKAMKELHLSRNIFFEDQCDFITDYLSQIKILPTDTEYEREIKKIKKIILFEIVHEDARPFLREIVGTYIQQKEGGSVAFEVPHIDSKTGYMDVVDTLDTGISTLSYVRNKLQHGFYDQVDAQLPQIVAPAYRKSKYIAKAAYEMLVELKIKPEKTAELDSKRNVSYEWLMRRVCSVGPDNIHNTTEIDEALLEFGDGVERLNPKRYQA